MIKARKQDKIIGFDLDGVIIDHTQNKLLVAKKLGVLLDILETPSDILKEKVKSDIEKRIEKIIYDEPSVALTPPLFPGAKAAIRKVSQSWPYFLISRRTFNGCVIKLLTKRGLWPKYFNEKNAFFVQTKEDKNLKAKELGINIYIDDQPSVLEKLVDVRHRLLHDPLSVYPDSGNYKKVLSWKDFLENIKYI